MRAADPCMFVLHVVDVDALSMCHAGGVLALAGTAAVARKAFGLSGARQAVGAAGGGGAASQEAALKRMQAAVQEVRHHARCRHNCGYLHCAYSTGQAHALCSSSVCRCTSKFRT